MRRPAHTFTQRPLPISPRPVNAPAAKWRVSRCFKRKGPASFALTGLLKSAINCLGLIRRADSARLLGLCR